MTASAPPRPRAVERGAVDRVHGDVGLGRGAVPDPLAVEEHRRVVLLPLADDHHAVHGDRRQHDAHGVDRRTVRPFLVAPAHPPGRGQRRGLGDPDEFHGQVAVGCLRRSRSFTHTDDSRAPPVADVRTGPKVVGSGRRDHRLVCWADDPSGVMGGFEPWPAAYAAASLRDADFETMSGVPLRAGLRPTGVTLAAHRRTPAASVEWPGRYPYTRGPYASMYRSKLWTMRMFAGFGTAEDTNARFRDLLPGRRRRALGRLRPAHAHGPRLRRPAVRGGGGSVRRGRRHPGRHRRPLLPASTSAQRPRR